MEIIKNERGRQPRKSFISIFATLVLHRVLTPLSMNGDPEDNGFGSLPHLFAYMDVISSTDPLEDVFSAQKWRD